MVSHRDVHRTEVRNRILAAARKQFAVHGYDGVSMRWLAAAIGYTAAALYYYFPDKERLIEALCVEDFSQLTRAFMAGETATDPLDRLLQAGRVFAEFGVRYPNHYRLMFLTPRREIGAAGAQAQRAAYEYLREPLRGAMAKGLLRKNLKDVELLAQTLWAAVHGVVALEIARMDGGEVAWRSFEKRVEAMLEILAGIRRKEG